MTIDEIFAKITTHQVEGMMIHSLFADYYEFLGLPSYSQCHTDRFLEESRAYKHTCRYFIRHYNKLPVESRIDPPNVIPSDWYNYTRQDVDVSTKRSAVKVGLERWVSWERSTKCLYQNMYKELLDLGEIAACGMVMELIRDVDSELQDAEQYHLNKKSLDYSIVNIVEEQ